MGEQLDKQNEPPVEDEPTVEGDAVDEPTDEPDGEEPDEVTPVEDEPTDEEEPFDKDRALGTIRKQRSENKTLKSKVSTLSVENRQLRVAIEKGLPLKLADRLRGDSLEDMRKDADELTNGVQTGWQPEYELEGGNRPSRERKKSAQDAAKEAAASRFGTKS